MSDETIQVQQEEGELEGKRRRMAVKDCWLLSISGIVCFSRCTCSRQGPSLHWAVVSHRRLEVKAAGLLPPFALKVHSLSHSRKSFWRSYLDWLSQGKGVADVRDKHMYRKWKTVLSLSLSICIYRGGLDWADIIYIYKKRLMKYKITLNREAPLWLLLSSSFIMQERICLNWPAANLCDWFIKY